MDSQWNEDLILSSENHLRGLNKMLLGFLSYGKECSIGFALCNVQLTEIQLTDETREIVVLVNGRNDFLRECFRILD